MYNFSNCLYEYVYCVGVDVNRVIFTNDYIVLFLVCAGGYLVVVEFFLVYGVDLVYKLKVRNL